MLGEVDLNSMLGDDSIKIIVLAGCGTAIAIIAIVFTMIKNVAIARAREATKREISAYVAEGSIDADKAVEILESDKPYWEKGEKPKKRKK